MDIFAHASAPSVPHWLALAPMDGITDGITRALLTDYNGGSAGVDLCASEFVRVTREPAPNKVLLRHTPELATGGCTPSGVPVFVQLLGGEPAPMAESARRAAALGALGVDINFGCPAKTVNRHDGGATLLKYPERMRIITATMRDALPPQVPLSVKIRTGWDHPEGVEQLAQAAQAGGAAFLTVHGRTRMDLYMPPANWQAIARARAAVRIPVLANGDLFSPAALQRCAQRSGCERFMLGRGVMAQPNLFRQIRASESPWSRERYQDFLHDYVQRMARADIPDSRALGRLKNWVCLGARVESGLLPVFDAIKRAPDLHSALRALEKRTA